MSMLIWIVALVVLGLLVLAIYARVMPVRATDHHIDPATVIPPGAPNFALLAGEGAIALAAAPDTVAAALAAAITSEGGVPLAGDLQDGFASFVFRSTVFGFPDVLSVRIESADTGSTVALYSRALLGYSDLGVNVARVARLRAAL